VGINRKTRQIKSSRDQVFLIMLYGKILTDNNIYILIKEFSKCQDLIVIAKTVDSPGFSQIAFGASFRFRDKNVQTNVYALYVNRTEYLYTYAM